MRGMNRCTIIGNLGADVEVNTYNDGFRVANFSVAVNETSTDRRTGERKTYTEWVRVAIINPNILDAVVAPGYMRKGGTVLIEGQLRTREYEKNGQRHFSTTVTVGPLGTVSLLGSPKDRATTANAQVGQTEPRLTPETADADVPF